MNQVVFDDDVIGLRGADAAAWEIVDLVLSDQDVMRLIGAVLAAVDAYAVAVAGRVRIGLRGWQLLFGGALGKTYVQPVALQVEAGEFDIGSSPMNHDGVPRGAGTDLRLVAGVGAVGDPRRRRAGTRDVQQVASRTGGVDAVHHVHHIAGQRQVRGSLNISKCSALTQAVVGVASRPTDVVSGPVGANSERCQGNRAHH